MTSLNLKASDLVSRTNKEIVNNTTNKLWIDVNNNITNPIYDKTVVIHNFGIVPGIYKELEQLWD